MMLNRPEPQPRRRETVEFRLRVVPLSGRGAPSCERVPRLGVPRNAEEWTALVKVGSGELDIPSVACACLLEMGLIVTVSGRPALTRHGRYTLGLPD